MNKEIILSFYELDIPVIPIMSKEGSEKKPAIQWKEYQSQGFPPLESFNNYSRIAMICRNGIEVLDIDTKYHDYEDEYITFSKKVYEMFPNKTFLIVKTPTGGYHYYFKSKYSQGNLVLAKNKNKKPKFETRGQGGYVLCPPTESYNIICGDFSLIPELTKEERSAFFYLCRSFDNQIESIPSSNDTVFDAYNKSDDILNELKLSGWKVDHEDNISVHLIRPGKESGASASFHKDKKTLYVFSTSTNFEQEKGLSPVDVFIQLHNVDIRQARKEFIKKGFGEGKKYNPLSPKKTDVCVVEEEKTKGKQKKKKSDIFKEAKEFLNDYYTIRYNIITNITEIREKGSNSNITELNENDLYTTLIENNIDINKNDLDSILNSSFVEQYDYFKEYFESLTYNGTGFIDKLSSYINVGDIKEIEFWNIMFKKALVRSIRCALGEWNNRYIIVLQSTTQNNGKSTFIRYLNPFPERYYTESPLASNKDTQFKFAQTFMYNLEELSSLNNKDIEQLKAIISQSSINERFAYAKNTKNLKRRTNFWASTNKETFLSDDQNTRWIIIKVRDINWDYIKDISIEDVYAEAYNLYKSNYNCELTREEVIYQTESNKQYELEGIEKNLIMKHVEFSNSEALGYSFMSITEIMNELLEMYPKLSNKIKNITFGKALKQVKGSDSDVKTINGRSIRGHYVKLNNKETTEIPF